MSGHCLCLNEVCICGHLKREHENIGTWGWGIGHCNRCDCHQWECKKCYKKKVETKRRIEMEKISPELRLAIIQAKRELHLVLSMTKILDKAEEIINRSKFKLLCNEIWDKCNEPSPEKYEDAITKEELNKAVKDIDYPCSKDHSPCQKVHFPEVTDKMTGEFADVWDVRGHHDALVSFRNTCQSGRYDKS